MTTEVYVKFENVEKSYDGENRVVKNLNLDIAKGEFVTMLGPSGSGKTTCLMMLAGFETTTSGSIILDNKEINSIPPYKRDIGMVFQNYALFPHMSVFDNVAYPLKIRKIPNHQLKEKVDNALGMIRMGKEFSNRHPSQLSGGQQQRVAVARALVFEPKLVLMDEPLGALDKNLREEMQYEIKKIHDDLGITIIYVTHDQTEALTMSDRVAIFNDGVIQQIDTPDVIYNNPKNKFVASFIGENNFLKGTLSKFEKNHSEITIGNDQRCLTRSDYLSAQDHDVLVSIRPEKIIINPPKSDEYTQVQAKINDIIFHGDHTRLQTTVLENNDFVIKVSNRDYDGQLNRNETILVGWKNQNSLGLAD